MRLAIVPQTENKKKMRFIGLSENGDKEEACLKKIEKRYGDHGHFGSICNAWNGTSPKCPLDQKDGGIFQGYSGRVMPTSRISTAGLQCIASPQHANAYMLGFHANFMSR
jgi:hypothetical protein